MIRHGEHNRAFYRPVTDSIHLPDKDQFSSADKYYATALHELGHATGHASRLDRDMAHPFGSEGYAREELRAEIASMILGDELGIGHDPAQHAAYVGAWIKSLQDDPLEIFRAAADAEKIQQFVLGLEQKQVQKLATQQEATQQDQVDELAVRLPSIEVGQSSQALLPEKIFIDVPFRQKDEARSLGAKWNRQEQSWYVPAGIDAASFARWTPGATTKTIATPQQRQNADGRAEPGKAVDKAVGERQYLAVPYGERTAAKAAGAEWDKAAKSWCAGPKADSIKLERWKPDSAARQQGPAMPPKEEFAEALRFLGCVVNGEHPVIDGQKHRISVEDEKFSEKAGAGFYVGFLDGHPAGYIKSNKTGIDMKWKSKGYVLDSRQKEQMQAEAADKQQARQARQERAQKQAAQRVARQMADLVPVQQPTPYMLDKGIEPQPGVFTDKDARTTCVPATDANGKQ